MKFAKILAIIACASLLSAGSARHVYAQDAGTADPEAGSWSADTDNSAESNSEAEVPAAKPPLDVEGCWSGRVHDRGEGKGNISIFFAQNGAKLVPSVGGFDVVWNAHNFAQGPIVSGSVSSNGVAFKGTATSNCAIHASGTGNAMKINGTYTFRRACSQAFKGGTFTIKPGCQ
jgi:hypothetical protein